MLRFVGTFPIPSYMLPALVNVDYSGLEPEDCELLDSWLATKFPNGCSVEVREECLNNPYFTAYPEVVHLGAEVVDVDFYEIM